MEELMDMIVSDDTPSNISDKIKELLFAKSAERIDNFRPAVASTLFGDDEDEQELEVEEEN